MSTPPFELTDTKPNLAPGAGKFVEKIPEKQLKEILKLEKIEKIEHKEKPEKHEHKEKPEKVEHKEKPEKFEHKEYLEKLPILEGGQKTLAAEIPQTDPGGPIEQGISSRVSQLEQAMGQMQHFITTNLRPDLSQGALKQEPDAAAKPGKN